MYEVKQCMTANERPVSQPCSGLSSSTQQVLSICWLVDLAAGRSLWNLPTLPCVHTQFYKVSLFLSWRQSNIQQVTWKQDSVVYQYTWGTVSILNILLHCQMLFQALIQGLQIHDLLVDSRFQYSSPSTWNLFSVVFLCHPRALVFFSSLVAPMSPSAFLFSLPLGGSLSRLGISQPTSPLDPGDESGGGGCEGRGATRRCSEVISVMQPIFKLPLPPPWVGTEWTVKKAEARHS